MSITATNLTPIWNSIVHALVGLVLFAVPLYLSTHTQVADLTVSTLAGMVLKYIDEHFGKTA